MKKLHRFFALVLVLALALGIAVPVTAAEPERSVAQILKMKNAEKSPYSSDVYVYPYSQTFGATAIKGGTVLLQFKLAKQTPSKNDKFSVIICRGSYEDLMYADEIDVVEERTYKMSDFHNGALGMTWKADSRYPVGEYTMISLIVDSSGEAYYQEYYAADLYVVDKHIPAYGIELIRLNNGEYDGVPDSLPFGSTYCFDYALLPYGNTADRTVTVTSSHPGVAQVYVDAGYVYVSAKGTGDVVITVKCGGFSYILPLCVGNEAVPTFSFSTDNSNLCVGMTDEPEVYFRDPGFPVAYSVYSENPDVVTVVDGVVTAVGPGTARVTAQIAKKTNSITYTVVNHAFPEDTPISEATATKPRMSVGHCSACGQENAVNIFAPAIFTDTDYRAWYSDHVDYVYDQGIMKGTRDDTFEPNTPLTRAMVVTVLYRVAGEPPIPFDELPFTDTNDSAWYSKAVLWANQNGIVNGVGNNRFAPNDNITREQIATILYRYSQFAGIEMAEGADLSTFPDHGNVGDFAAEGLSWAVAEELITGTVSGGVTYLSPKASATRAQLATIISRYQQMLQDSAE